MVIPVMLWNILIKSKSPTMIKLVSNIFFFYLAKWDPKKVSSDQMFRMFYLIHEAAMLEPETQIRGVVCIMDFEGLGMKQVKLPQKTRPKKTPVLPFFVNF